MGLFGQKKKEDLSYIVYEPGIIPCNMNASERARWEQLKKEFEDKLAKARKKRSKYG